MKNNESINKLSSQADSGPGPGLKQSDKVNVILNINGIDYDLHIDADETLLRVIRERLGLTGSKEGCGNGECGACTLLMDDVPVRSCMILAAECSGTSIVTIEGLGPKRLNIIQESFVDAGAVQCGFCIPGFIMAVEGLVRRTPDPSKEQIMEALSGHLCRCTGYENIFKAVDLALSRIRKQG
jgi:carbon-monoxide dehydrogenase small subunit